MMERMDFKEFDMTQSHKTIIETNGKKFPQTDINQMLIKKKKTAMYLRKSLGKWI